MKRYFRCRFRRPKAIEPEFVNGTPIEILSPLNYFQRPLPDDKDQLQAFDFELVEQIHLLEAEYNKYFQDAKHCIEKDDMTRGIHYMNRSREIKKRIDQLDKRHHEILDKLEAILMSHPHYQIYIRPRQTHNVKMVLKIPPTPN
jgi:hypothetical protein